MATRHRNIEAKSFLDTAFSTCSSPQNVEVVMFVDDDDNTYDIFDSPFSDTHILRGPRKNLPYHLRACANVSKGEILFFVNDDSVVQTDAWDEEIIKVHRGIKDSIYLCYPNDCFKGKNLAVFPIMSKFCYDKFEFFPVNYKGAFSDTHIHEIFRILAALGYDRIIFREDIIFRHNHYRITGKKPDRTYTDRERFGDDITFLKGVRSRFKTASLIRSFLNGKEKFEKKLDGEIVLENIIPSILFYIFKFPGNYNYRIGLGIKLSLRYIYRTLFG